MYKVDITKSAGKFIKDLSPKQYRQVVSTILALRVNPTPHDSKQLSGYPEYQRVDIGEYRIVYRFDKDTVYIAVIGKRNDDEVVMFSFRGQYFDDSRAAPITQISGMVVDILKPPSDYFGTLELKIGGVF